MTLDDIELPDDLLWVNEFDWNPVEQNIERSLSGALLIQEQSMLGGRPIELSGGEDAGWVTRDKVLMLYSLANALSNTMTLTLPDSRQFEVMFDRRNNTPIMAQPLWAKAYTTNDDFYLLTLRLITVGP